MSARQHAAAALRQTWPVRHHADREVARRARAAIRAFLRVLRGVR